MFDVLQPGGDQVRAFRDRATDESGAMLNRLKFKKRAAVGQSATAVQVHEQYHESLEDVTTAGAFEGSRNEILDQRAVAKARTVTKRSIQNLRLAG